MKYLSLLRLFIALFTGSLFLSSCKHDHDLHKLPFKVRTSTWYRISPTAPVPLTINGIDYTGTAFFPGGGSGTASHMGDVNIFFNQQTYSTSADGPPLGSIAASIKDVPSYPITGAPLPLIQTGDFAELAALNSSLQIPSSVKNNIINLVIYNKKGDAVFSSAITGSGSTFPISETLVGFNGKAIILGGRGRFKHAIGEIDYSGYFNVTNPADAEYNADGWIDY